MSSMRTRLASPAPTRCASSSSTRSIDSSGSNERRKDQLVERTFQLTAGIGNVARNVAEDLIRNIDGMIRPDGRFPDDA